MDEARLIEKLRAIEALFAGATTPGEKDAAGRALGRILERLKEWEVEDPPIEYRFSMADMWSRKVFLALLRRYGIHPYRFRGQRYTTIMAKVSKRFVDETLWPEFNEISSALQVYLSEVTDRVVQEVIHKDSSEAEIVEKPKQLPLSIPAADKVLSPTISQTEENEKSGRKKAAKKHSRGAKNKRKKPKTRK